MSDSYRLYLFMQRSLCLVTMFMAILLVTTVSAITFKIPQLQPSAFSDGEASETRHMPVSSNVPNIFQVILSHNASLSNNVEVAFGRDIIPSDGLLDAEEATFVLGWDSGVWFLGKPDQSDILTATPVDSGIERRRTLTFKLRLSHVGVPQEVLINDDTSSLNFPSLPCSLEPLISSVSWDTLRVTTRGRELSEENVAVTFIRDGLVIIMK